MREEFARSLGRIGRRLSDLEEARTVHRTEESMVCSIPTSAPRVAVRREHAELVTSLSRRPTMQEAFGDGVGPGGRVAGTEGHTP